MDTILTLFDSAGTLVTFNDDGSSGCFGGAVGVAPGTNNGNADPNTGSTWDTCLSSVLSAGAYTVAVSQYDNFANGPNVANGFQRDQGNYTGAFGGCSNGSFCDVNGTNRTNFWAYDILNVDQAVIVPMPEPGILVLLGFGLLGFGLSRRKS